MGLGVLLVAAQIGVGIGEVGPLAAGVPHEDAGVDAVVAADPRGPQAADKDVAAFHLPAVEVPDRVDTLQYDFGLSGGVAHAVAAVGGPVEQQRRVGVVNFDELAASAEGEVGLEGQGRTRCDRHRALQDRDRFAAVCGPDRQGVAACGQVRQTHGPREIGVGGAEELIVTQACSGRDCARTVTAAGAGQHQSAIDQRSVGGAAQGDKRQVRNRHRHGHRFTRSLLVDGGDHHGMAARTGLRSIDAEAVHIEAAGVAPRARVGLGERGLRHPVKCCLNPRNAVLRAGADIDMDGAGGAGDLRRQRQIGVGHADDSAHLGVGVARHLDPGHDQVRAVGLGTGVPSDRIARAGGRRTDEPQVGVPAHRGVGQSSAYAQLHRAGCGLL